MNTENTYPDSEGVNDPDSERINVADRRFCRNQHVEQYFTSLSQELSTCPLSLSASYSSPAHDNSIYDNQSSDYMAQWR